VTTAQLLFSIALGAISTIIVLFAIYVVSSATWSNRWIRKPDERSKNGGESQ